MQGHLILISIDDIYLKSLNLHLWLWLSGGELRENIYFTVLRSELLHRTGLGIEYLR